MNTDTPNRRRTPKNACELTLLAPRCIVNFEL